MHILIDLKYKNTIPYYCYRKNKNNGEKYFFLPDSQIPVNKKLLTKNFYCVFFLQIDNKHLKGT